MTRPSVLLLPLVLTTFLATATVNAQDYTAPDPTPPPASSPPPPSPPPPPPPAASAWTPANVSDQAIQQVAQFAVRIYAHSKKELRMSLVNVVSAETQTYNGGYNYRLVVTVSGGKKVQYDAFVWGILGTTSWKLLYFEPKY